MTDKNQPPKSESLTLRALDLWREITGVEPAKYGTASSDDWEVRRGYEELQEAIDLDPTEVTAAMLLDHFVRSRAATLMDLLDDPDATLREIEKPRELLALLARPEIADGRAAFISMLLEAAKRYDAGERSDVQKILGDNESVALLRRDALRSLTKLRVDQFLDGQPEPEGRVPVYTKHVHMWWNINSLLAAATRMPAGVSLNLIRDPSEFQSYFVFAIRNGANLFVLSDVPEFSHPLQASMSRRPDREFEKRAARNWFPYDLTSIEYDEESGRLFEGASKSRSVAAYQGEAVPIKLIADLGAPEMPWIAMMFDLIVDRFWHNRWRAPQLSYTAEMVRVEHALLDRAADAGLPVALYQPISTPALTRADVRDADEEAIGKRKHRPNDWLEQRFGHLVPESVFNMVASPEQKFMLTGPVTTGQIAEDKRSDWDSRHPFLAEGEKPLKLVALNSTAFGSREQIEADRKFLARYNYAGAISRLAKQEFVERERAVIDWYVKRCKVNLPALLAMARHERIWLLSSRQDGTFGNGYRGRAGAIRSKRVESAGSGLYDGYTLNSYSFLERYTLGSDKYSYRFAGARNLGGFNTRNYLCCLNATSATYLAVFSPTNAQELAMLAGCTVADLPDVLQHWTLESPYAGNSILDRIDPMVWHADDPWAELDLRISLPLSKRAVAALQKAAAPLPEFPNFLSTDVVPAWAD